MRGGARGREAPAHGIAPGLSDPVFASQAVFRLALKALSEPARPYRLPQGGFFAESPPARGSLLALALALADNRTRLWLSPSLGRLGPYLAFHTGAGFAGPGEADFLLCGSEAELPPLGGLRLGTDQRPDLSATIALCLPGDGGGSFLATGPGIEDAVPLSGIGLSGRLAAERDALSSLFPLGPDIIVCLEGALLGLPRSTRLRALGPEGPGAKDGFRGDGPRGRETAPGAAGGKGGNGRCT
jgi:alpha-D-ribose 1-methylphosphonate 5-triphosphate synthase subunit PhnH